MNAQKGVDNVGSGCMFASSNQHNVVWMFFEIVTSQCRGVGDDEVVTDCSDGALEEWTKAKAKGIHERVNALG